MLTVLSAVLLLSATNPAAEVARAMKPFESDAHTEKDFAASLKIVEGLGEKAVAPLLERLKREGTSGTWFACEALGRVGGVEALPALAARFSAEDWVVRASCATGYGAILSRVAHDPAVVEPLRTLLKGDPKCEVRINGALAAGPAEDPSLRGDWETALRSPDKFSCDRRVALMGLRAAKANRDRLGPLMLPILNDSEEDPWTREAAADALGELAFALAREPFLALLEGKDPGANVRAEAIEGLGAVGLPKDVARLKRVIKEDPYGGKGIWAVNARAAIKRIESRAKAGGRK